MSRVWLNCENTHKPFSLTNLKNKTKIELGSLEKRFLD